MISFLNKAGLVHWLIQRFSAILMFILLFFYFDNIFVFSLFLIILSYHIFVGIETLLNDYIHDIDLLFFGYVFLRLFILFLLKIILLLCL